MSYTILVIDDEKNIRLSLKLVLEGAGYRVILAENGNLGLQLAKEKLPDLILLDVVLPDINGLDILKLLKSSDKYLKEVPVIMISGQATLREAVEAVKIGAEDFLEKPIDRDKLLIVIANLFEKYRIKYELETLRREIEDRYEMVGRSKLMQELYTFIEKIAPTNGKVLITGESGTGKELVARAIHKLSNRAEKPFIKLNCAAIPSELIESELFGYEKGAFTGAVERKKGMFELADGGTLFLDEIGDMDLNVQAKLLTVLQSGELTRVGGTTTIKVDVRIIAATNKNLEEEIKKGKFREDLYYRLNVIPIHTPSLRERKEDIPLLVNHFIKQFCKENGLKPKPIDEEVIVKLQAYSWPGNVRELKNLIERMVILSGDRITEKELPDYIRFPGFHQGEGGELISLMFSEYKNKTPTLREFKEIAEKAFIISVLRKTNWNISQASLLLGIERTNLHKKIRYYNIKKPDE